MTVVDDSGASVCLLVDDDGLLVGLLTDGDLRRAMLHGAELDSPALEHATRTPQTVAERLVARARAGHHARPAV